MKVGILTFHIAHNYGALLQAYSLRRFLCDSGNDAFFIDYAPEALRDAYSNKVFKKSYSVRRALSAVNKQRRRRNQARLFEDFIRNELACDGKARVTSAGLQGAANECGAVIVGSDQVWNADITINDDAYYLPFETSAKKISYAASFGKAALSEFESAMATAYLGGFGLVTVRESAAIGMLDRLGISAELVVDPVFLQDVSVWRELARKPSSLGFLESGFCFMYALAPNSELFEAAGVVAADFGLPTLCAHPFCTTYAGMNGKMLRDIGPREFLYMIDNAQAVFSNSFHCMAYSLMMGKKVYYTPNGNLGLRVDSLLDLACAPRVNKGHELVEVDFTSYGASDDLTSTIRRSKELLVKGCSA